MVWIKCIPSTKRSSTRSKQKGLAYSTPSTLSKLPVGPRAAILLSASPCAPAITFAVTVPPTVSVQGRRHPWMMPKWQRKFPQVALGLFIPFRRGRLCPTQTQHQFNGQNTENVRVRLNAQSASPSPQDSASTLPRGGGRGEAP